MHRFHSPLLLVPVWLSLAASMAFSQAVSFTESTSPYFSLADTSIFHADFNSDGREDFIVFGFGSNGCPSSAFGLVLSTGNGTYAPPVCYTLPAGSPYVWAIGDFNGDGNADVIVSNGSTSLYEYLGSSSGALHLQATFVAGTPVAALAAADVNHDGKIDLLFNSSSSSDPNLHVWFGNGNGSFTVGPSTAMTVAGGSLSIGDFDGDGKGDIYTELGGPAGRSHQVFYGDGTGHFQPAAAFSDDVSYAVYDVNGDGRSDLIGQPFDFSLSGNTYYNQVRILYGNGNRTFTTAHITLAHCDAWLFPPAAADLNGDGVNDLAVVEAADCKGSAPDTFNVLPANANGTYQHEQPIFTGTTSELLSAPLVLRADPDSEPDLMLFDVSSGTLKTPGFLFQNTTVGNFPACSPPNRYTGITLCAPTRTIVSSSPVRFSIGAANQTPGRKVEVWIDGKKRSEQLKHAFSYYSFLDASYSLSPGTHRVTVFSAGWDNLLESSTFSLTVGSSTCPPPSSPGINVCSPLNNSTVRSPVLAWASGTVTGAVARMEVWVDGVKRFSTYGVNTLKTNLTLASGAHSFSYYIVNTAGQKWNQIVYATVP